MAKMTYTQQLAHPSWQRRRLEMLSAADWKCTACSDTEKQLHVHHRAYFKGRLAWEYADHELAVLCSTCHSAEHEAKELLDELLLAIPQDRLPVRTALSLLSGYFGADSELVFDASVKIEESGLSDINAGMGGSVASMLIGLPLHRYVEAMGFINGLRVQEGLDEQ